jgi:hypothetical protein
VSHDDVLNLAAPVVSGQRKATDIPADQSEAFQTRATALTRRPRKVTDRLTPNVKIAPVIDDQYLPLAQLVVYSGMSRHTLRRFITASADAALPCYRPGGKIMVKRSEFDAWMGRHRAVGDVAVNQLLSEMGFPLSRGGDTC